MLSILASGTLIADPVERHSVSGKNDATALLRVSAEDAADPLLVSLIAYTASAVQEPSQSSPRAVGVPTHVADKVLVASRDVLTEQRQPLGARHDLKGPA